MQNIYCKCIIYASVSILKIQNFSKAMNRHLLERKLINWAIVCEGLDQVADKTQRCGFQVKLRWMLTFIGFSLWTNNYFLIESITQIFLNQHMHFILLTILMFKKLFWCKERVVSLHAKYLLQVYYLCVCQQPKN